MRPSPSITDRLVQRTRELDTAIAAALACGEFQHLTQLPTGTAKVIVVHLHDLRARVAQLDADLASIIAIARAGEMVAA